MKNWIIVVAVSLVFFAVGYGVYYGIGRWTPLSMDSGTAHLTILTFGIAPIFVYAMVRIFGASGREYGARSSRSDIGGTRE